MWHLKVSGKSVPVAAETLLYTALVLVLLICLGNVSPPIRELVEGLLP